MTRRDDVPTVLTIAGSDPSGGAGIQADLKTFAAWRCYGTSVVTALTAQNTRGVDGVLPTPADFVDAQLTTLLDDVRIDAVKIGMLGSVEVAQVVARHLRGSLAGVSVVLDPVMVATSGDSLAADGVLEAIRGLAGLCTVVTPNLPEAARLCGQPQATNRDEMRAHASAIQSRAVLLKGGHLAGDKAIDLLRRGEQEQWFSADHVETRNTHGTGCTLSSAIAANLALGLDLPDAVATAKRWLTEALRRSDELHIGDGTGHGPVNHLSPTEGFQGRI